MDDVLKGLQRDQLALSTANAAIVLQESILGLLIVKGVISAPEATMIVRKTRDRLKDIGGPGAARVAAVIDYHFEDQLKNDSWSQRHQLMTGKAEGTA